jgi:hypothetical protein
METNEMANPITAVIERADFGPAYAGEDFVTLTFRVPKDTGAIPGIWELKPLHPGQLDWAVSKTDYDRDGE